MSDSKTKFRITGANWNSIETREANDYYATDPEALEIFLSSWGGRIAPNIWECACGSGHLSRVLEKHGYNVKSTDLIYRGYGEGGIDFLKTDTIFDGDIVTNPPYSLSKDFVEHSLDVINPGSRAFMFMKLLFLEGQKRKSLFQRKELEYVYVFSKRMRCAKNGDFSKYNNSSSVTAYAWFVFKKGYNNEPVIRWL